MFSKNLPICLALKLHLNDIDGAKICVFIAIATKSILVQKRIDGAKNIYLQQTAESIL